jgi:hypothetical protein
MLLLFSSALFLSGRCQASAVFPIGNGASFSNTSKERDSFWIGISSTSRGRKLTDHARDIAAACHRRLLANAGSREREPVARRFCLHVEEEVAMGKGILLWLLGIPIPIIILILIFWH